MIELQDLLPFTKKLKLLCIEPDDSIRMSLVKTFSKVFAQVDESADGYDGLNHYKINQHDLIISETKLGNYSALQMVEQIKKVSPSAHVIIISNDTDINTLLSWTNMGIQGYVPKPIKMQSLLEVMYKSCSVLYSNAQKVQLVEASSDIKRQKQQMQAHYEANEIKLQESLAYERKRLGGLLGSQRELQKHLSDSEQKLKMMRILDDLTGLKNKHALKDEISKEGEKALLFVDIDHFESINTIYGMGYGNKVLKETASRIQKFLPSNTELFRISADEFVVLMNSPTPNQELLLSQQILAMFQQAPILIGEIEFDISFSMGMDRGSHNKLFVHAKTASAEAKEKGRSQMVVFKNDSDYVKRQRDTLFWINTVKEALVNDRVMSYYQPIHNNETGNIEKYEALCRILDKEGKVLEASSFIHPAFLAGLTTKISKVMIDKAFKYFQSNSYAFSLNISTQDFNENYLEEFLQYKCDYYHISPSRVYLEVVESITINEKDKTLHQIQRLRSKGFNITIDDFGVEQSVFSRLLRLEAKTIKIDSSFIENIDTNLSHQLIVKNIVAFAHRIGAQTVAEYVETQSVHDKVCELGIDYSQGYFIGEPKAQIINNDPMIESSVNNIA
ncbi:EAL domain-containing protein [Sulfurimonas sp. MAG313]|nr:EAL domain-containing protein [Sulfurimonas sp. MAG313]MDF1881278.1 EAL domain-containing protein [Sulfurimonas sp. MAG313]